MEDGSTKCLFFRYSDKMDTRSKSKERAQAQEALAKARAVEDSEEVTKKRIPITQAKLRRLNAKNSVKTALNQIRDAIETFNLQKTRLARNWLQTTSTTAEKV